MSQGAIAHVAATTKIGSGSGVTSDAMDTTGANLLVVVVAYYNNSPVPTLSDSKGNSWTALTNRPVGGNASIRMFWCTPTAVGSGHTVTVGNASGTYSGVAFQAFSGAAASPYDQESGTAGSGTPGSITPSEDNCLLVTGCSINQGTYIGVSDSFTASTINGGGAAMGTGIAYKIQTTASAANPTWTKSGGSGMSAAMASFKAASAGGGGSPAPALMNFYRRLRTTMKPTSWDRFVAQTPFMLARN